MPDFSGISNWLLQTGLLELLLILFDVITEKAMSLKMSEQVKNHHEGHIVLRTMVNHYRVSTTNSETSTFLHPHLPIIALVFSLFVILNASLF